MDGLQTRVIVGKINGLFGVRGWVKVFSYTDPVSNILTYSPWCIRHQGDWQDIAIAEGQQQGKRIVVRLAPCHDRDAAAQWLGADVAVYRTQLPPPAQDEYYWNDLIGLRVINQADMELGTVDYLIETGANDVLVVKGERERLIPFVVGHVIIAVMLEQGCIRVDWDADF